MILPRKHLLLAQRLLNEHVNADLVVDGVFGAKSVEAANQWVGHLPTRRRMTAQRWAALVIQQAAFLEDNTVTRDAWYGPNTRDAAYRLMGETFDRPDEASAHVVSKPRCWTPTDAQMIEQYGKPGSGQVMTPLPFPMRLDWDTETTVIRTQCHRLVRDSLVSVLEAVLDHYGLEEIRRLNIDRFGGVLNVRKKRGGSTWSAHAWGSAIDLWPSANQMSWKRDRAAFARPEYVALRKCFRDNGWMSLGECYDFDYQHFQVNPS